MPAKSPEAKARRIRRQCERRVEARAAAPPEAALAFVPATGPASSVTELQMEEQLALLRLGRREREARLVPVADVVGPLQRILALVMAEYDELCGELEAAAPERLRPEVRRIVCASRDRYRERYLETFGG